MQILRTVEEEMKTRMTMEVTETQIIAYRHWIIMEEMTKEVMENPITTGQKMEVMYMKNMMTTEQKMETQIILAVPLKV